MSFSSAQECAIRALRERDPEGNLVILVSKDDVKDVLNIVGATIGLEAKSQGGSWKFDQGNFVCVRRSTDPPIDLEGGFSVVVCNGGRNPSSEEKNGIEEWKDAS